MGDTLSTLRLWEKDPRYSGVKAKIKNLDDETRKLVDEFLREQDNVHEQKNKLEKQYIQLEKIYDFQTQELRKEIESLKAELKQADHKESQQSKIIDGFQKEQTKYVTEIEYLQRKIRKLQEVEEKLRKDSQTPSTETGSALSRMHIQACLQQPGANVEFSELCDSNRPARLAEEFMILYSEEWIKAFDEIALAKADARKNCQIEKELCNIAKTCYTICQNIERKQMTEFEVHAWDIACGLHKHPDQILYSAHTKDLFDPFLIEPLGMKESNFDPRMTAIHKCRDAIIQIVIDRRSNDKQLMEYVKQAIVRHFEHFNKSGSKVAVINYVRKCAELCWKMVIKSPPMILVCDQMEGTPIDRKMFSYYTNPGAVVDFVVWPAIMLHLEGTVLQKGVVQGKEEMKFKYNAAQVCTGNPISE